VNGSIPCTTPCSIDVPSYYFGAKHTAYSKHGETPIVVRLSKQGYLPKTIVVTTGSIHWKNLNGVNVYDYYLVSEASYSVRLETADSFFSQPESHAGVVPIEPPKPASVTPVSTSNEDIVRERLATQLATTTKSSRFL
jgi:serine protease Do